MKVVVWQAYGGIDVYAADTPAQLKAVIEAMIAAVEGWGLEAVVKGVRKRMVQHPDHYGELNLAFIALRNAVVPGSHEMFENIQINTVKELT